MKVIVLCNRYLSAFDCAIIQSIQSSDTIEIVGGLINTRSRGSLMSRLKREWKKGRGGFVLIQAIRTLRKKVSRTVPVKAEDHLKEIPLKETSSLYNEEVYNWIKEQKADCLLLRGFGIIREPVLSICPHGVVSYHHGDLRKYRGGPPAFWELYHNEKEIGVTIQVLDEGLDTGTIVLQRFFPVQPSDTWNRLRDRIYAGSANLAREALEQLDGSGPLRNPVGEVGTLYTLPNLNQWLALQFKIIGRKLRR